MDSHSEETLQRVEVNDSTLETLLIGGTYKGLDGAFCSRVGDDVSRLGNSATTQLLQQPQIIGGKYMVIFTK